MWYVGVYTLDDKHMIGIYKWFDIDMMNIVIHLTCIQNCITEKTR